MNIPMVDLKGQYHKIKEEIDQAILECIDSAHYIKGPEVTAFENSLSNYLDINHTIGCGNGTDALQIALMALELNPDDKIIVPAFTYVATAEAIALLGLKPVMVDVDQKTFNLKINDLEQAITEKTRALVPVHLFGQSAEMEPIMKLADKYKLWVIEDNAQSLGADYAFSDGSTKKTGTIGHIGCHSFFPTKNLGCFGDGGAITTNDTDLAEKCRMIATHGQKQKYHHSVVGCNSRLDTIQAAVLNVKLKYLDDYISSRQKAADYYYRGLMNVNGIILPENKQGFNHTFNQFTLIVKENRRDHLHRFLKKKGVPSVIYYPLPLYKQEAFQKYGDYNLENTEYLCSSVLSIPMHTEIANEVQDYIIETIKEFFSPENS